MSEPDQPADSPETLPQAPPNPEAETFFFGAFDRIRRIMLAFAAFATVAVWLRWGVAVGVGMALGCVISLVNFVWLKRIVAAMADRITRAQAAGERGSARGMVLRYLLRYVFIAAAAYVIFRVSTGALYGLLAGLFLPVAAILCEAGYEVAVALKRGL